MTDISNQTEKCAVCGSVDVHEIGTKVGSFRKGYVFRFYQCAHCFFSFVGNPWTEYDRIYSQAYYSGDGADPLADYAYELDNPNDTIRQYEWRGILNIAGSLLGADRNVTWLDYGCGHGGLVRYANQAGLSGCIGFEEGHIADVARRRGVPIVKREDLVDMHGKFDLVTAIEVIEHVPNPIEFLSSIRALLKPGGILLLTTGNAKPYRNAISNWSYASVPEVHVSFFEPDTLALALKKSGFLPVQRGYIRGYEDVIKFKVLKNLHVRRRNAFFDVLPWSVLSRIVDRRFGVTAHPSGIAA